MQDLRDAVVADPMGRLNEVIGGVEFIQEDAASMCRAELFHQEGMLPKHLCRCNTEVNSMLYDDDDVEVFCVVELNTVLSSFVFRDVGDCLWSAASSCDWDEPNLFKVTVDMEFLGGFTKGYGASTSAFPTPIEV